MKKLNHFLYGHLDLLCYELPYIVHCRICFNLGFPPKTTCFEAIVANLPASGIVDGMPLLISIFKSYNLCKNVSNNSAIFAFFEASAANGES